MQSRVHATCATKSSELLLVDQTARVRVTTGCQAASAFGDRRLREVDDTVRLAVTTWAMTSLQDYKLAQASELLRACGALCPPVDPAIIAGVGFLMMHQRNDGAFGFLGPECTRLSETRPDVRPELDVTGERIVVDLHVKRRIAAVTAFLAVRCRTPSSREVVLVNRLSVANCQSRRKDV